MLMLPQEAKTISSSPPTFLPSLRTPTLPYRPPFPAGPPPSPHRLGVPEGKIPHCDLLMLGN